MASLFRVLAAAPRDLALAARALRKRPAITLVAAVTVALPLALVGSVFSLVDAVLLRPLPLDEPARLVRVREVVGEGAQGLAFSPTPDVLREWRVEGRMFTGMAGATGARLTLTGRGEPERVATARVTWDFFRVLGTRPARGRDFLPSEDRPGGPAVVIVGDRFWHSHLAGSETALGSRLVLDGVPHSVIGVMPPRFRHPYDADLWVPLALPADAAAPGLYVPARLRPGISVAEAQRELGELARRLAADRPGARRPRAARLTPLRQELVGDLDAKLLTLWAGAALVLLMACANLANLQTAQALARRGEMAIEAALGSGRARLAGRIVAESVLLSVLGGLLALPLTALLLRGILAYAPFTQGDYASPMNEFDVGARLGLATFGFLLAASLVVGVAFGVVPALRASRPDVRQLLDELRSGISRHTGRLLGSLVVAEVAVAVVVVIGAGLVYQSFRRLASADPGYRAAGAYVLQVDLPETRYPDGARIAAFVQGAVERLRALPGVTAAGATTVEPLDPGTTLAAANPDADAAPDPPGYFLVHHRQVVPGYFDALGVLLLRGRDFGPGDRAGGNPVVVVSRSLAERFWPGQDPVGHRVKHGRLDDPRPWMTVVGVVDDVRESADPADPEVVGTWYLPLAQRPELVPREMSFVVRGPGDPDTLLAAAREAIRGDDRQLAVGLSAPMETLLAESLTEERFTAAVVAIFALAALLLAGLGIYGVLSYTVSQRSHELAVRAALGAVPRRLLRSVLAQACGLLGLGLALGLAMAWSSGHLLATMLFGIRAGDPATFVAGAVFLSLAVLGASLAPAWRAAKAVPVAALRGE